VPGGLERLDLRLPHPAVRDPLRGSSRTSLIGEQGPQQLVEGLLVAARHHEGMTARTDAVRGILIASATSPKVSPGRSMRRSPIASWVTFSIPGETT
jgi:hypothetical protein